MKAEKQITVIIPNYNGMKFMKDCLDSIYAGTFIPHVIVVDNHSTDGSREMIERDYPKVKVLALSANTGFCHAVNAGLHITRTRYALLLNNDTKVDPRCVEELYNAIATDGRIFSVQAKMLSMKDPHVIDDAGDLFCALGWAFARGKAKTAADHYNKKEEIFSACAGAAIYRMRVFDEIGWFDERHYCYLEDVDIGYRAQIYGYRNYFAPKAIVYHHGSASSGSVHNPFKEEMTAGNSYYLLYKNMPVIQYGINYPLIRLGISVKRKYFHKKGLGKAYESGVVRGQYLKAEAQDQALSDRYEVFYRKGTIAEEAVLIDDYDPGLDGVIPLYLGKKVPFAAGHLPNYVRIQGKLWANMFRRLSN